MKRSVNAISLEQVKLSDLIICRYRGKLFPCVITASFPDGNKATVKAMQKCIGGWKWPEKDDEIDYYDNQIILMKREENQHILNVLKLFDQS